MQDNVAGSSFVIKEGGNNYIDLTTEDTKEKITLGNNGGTNPTLEIQSDTTAIGTVTFDNTATFEQSTTFQQVIVVNNDVNLEAGGGNTIFWLQDNQGSAFHIKEGGNDYIKLDTTDSSEEITIGDGAGSTANITIDGAAAVLKINTQDINFETGSGNTFWWLEDNSGSALVMKEGTNEYIKIDTTNSGEKMTLGSSVAKTVINLKDNQSSAFELGESGTKYIEINTTDNAELMNYGNITTEPDHNFIGDVNIGPGPNVLTFVNADSTTPSRIDVNGALYLRSYVTPTYGTYYTAQRFAQNKDVGFSILNPTDENHFAWYMIMPKSSGNGYDVNDFMIWHEHDLDSRANDGPKFIIDDDGNAHIPQDLNLWGKTLHQPLNADARSVLVLHPFSAYGYDSGLDAGVSPKIDFDNSWYATMSDAGEHYLDFAIEPVQLYGGKMRIKKITAMIDNAASNDFVTSVYIQYLDEDGTNRAIWTDTTDLNGAGIKDHTIYNSTGIDLNGDTAWNIEFDLFNVSGGSAVKIRRVRIEYETI
jgi:hypothetical protein